MPLATLMFGLQQSIADSYRFQGAQMKAQDGLMNLAGNMDPAISMEQRFEMGKALELQAAHSKVMFAATQALREAREKQLKEELDLQKRLNQIWNS